MSVWRQLTSVLSSIWHQNAYAFPPRKGESPQHQLWYLTLNIRDVVAISNFMNQKPHLTLLKPLFSYLLMCFHILLLNVDIWATSILIFHFRMNKLLLINDIWATSIYLRYWVWLIKRDIATTSQARIHKWCLISRWVFINEQL